MSTVVNTSIKEKTYLYKFAILILVIITAVHYFESNDPLAQYSAITQFKEHYQYMKMGH